MKKILLLLFLGIAGSAGAQQENMISHSGIGGIRLGMSRAEAEKLLGVPLILKHIGIDDELEDTFPVKYKGADMVLYMKRSYDDSAAVAVVSKVHTGSTLFKTAAGLGVGSDKTGIITSMGQYYLHVTPDYADADFKARSRTRATIIILNDESSHVMIFRLNNKKVDFVEVNDYHDWY